MENSSYNKIARMMLQSASYLPGIIHFYKIGIPKNGREDLQEELAKSLYTVFCKVGYIGTERDFVSLFRDVHLHDVRISCDIEVEDKLCSLYHTAPVYITKKGISCVLCNGLHRGLKKRNLDMSFCLSLIDANKSANVAKFDKLFELEQKRKEEKEKALEHERKYVESLHEKIIKHQKELESHKQLQSLLMSHEAGYSVYCPLCDSCFDGSTYLKDVFDDIPTLWLANMVTHYRHNHITSWNKMWGDHGFYYRQAAHYDDMNYEDRKSEINERAKRQIVRKAAPYLRKNNVTIKAFENLQGTTVATLQTVRKIL